MQNMFRDEMKTLQQKVERIENALWETVSEFSLPGVEQSVILSIFPAAGGGGLEGAISVGHLADVYAEYINWNGKSLFSVLTRLSGGDFVLWKSGVLNNHLFLKLPAQTSKSVQYGEAALSVKT